MFRADRLFELRKGKGLTQKVVASNIKIDRTTYVRYEKEQIQPPIDMTIRLADFFGVSIGYLLGLSNSPDDDMTLDELESALIDEVHGLDEEDKKELLKDAQRRKKLQELLKKHQAEEN